MSIEGIDLSDWQGQVNWPAIRQAGKRFAFIKATEGLTVADPWFRYSWAGAHSVGMVRAAYHFLHPDLDGIEQADFLHKTVRDSGHFLGGDMVMVDIELATNGAGERLPNDQIVHCAEQFVLRCRAEIDKQVLVYTGFGFWEGIGNPGSTVLGHCPLVLADWGPPSTIRLPAPWPLVSFQQYSASGHVPGVNGACDLDRFYGDMKQLNEVRHHYVR